MKFFLTKALFTGFLIVFLGQGMLFGQEGIQKAISGRVTDEQNQPLMGATVLVKGTETGTITDLDGKFEILATAADVLIVSYVGYASKEITPGDQTSLVIQLSADLNALDEVVVVAYGVQKRSDVTGAIGSANTDDFNKGVVVNPGQLLQGKVAGVNVSNVSGEPGAEQNVIIRGIGSLRSGTTPLYVVDGFVLDNAALNFINPQDIATIDVLKDASAAAIYGARAANGVIVITTKKGKAGQSQVSVSASTAFSSLANKIGVFSADEFRRQVVAAGGTLDDKGGNTDWQDELTRVANSSDVNFSMSGAASEQFSYFISAALQNQEGIFNNSGIKRYSGRVNLSQQAWGGRLKIDYNFTGARTENDRPNIGSTVVDMLVLNPTIPAFTNGEPTLLDERLNPLTRNAIFFSESYNNRLLGNIAPSIELVRGLTYKLNVGLDYSTSEGISQTQPYDLLEGLEFGSLGTFTNVNENQLVENTLTYNLNKRAHNLTVLAGHSYQKTFARGRSFNLSGFVNNDILPVYQDQTSTQDRPTTYNSFAVENELQSFFGRVNYSLDGKYLVTATMRADGSSKFGANNKYGYFPSFALGWNIGKERFLSGSAFDNLKLRASWGQTGNQEIPSKITQASFTDSRSNNNTYPLDPNATTLDGYPYGTIFTRLANPDIQWEVSTQTDFGLDFALFDYGLTGTLDVFSKVSENILLEVVPADPIQPTATYWTNVPDMEIRNNGVELTLEYNSNPAKAFQYSIGGNISFIDNEVVNSPFSVLTTGGASGAGQTGATINGYINGEPIGAFYMKEFAGIGEDGLNRFVDQNGDGQVLENDRIVVGTALPNTLFGFNLSAKYKGLDVGVNFNGVSGNKIYNHTAMSLFQKGSLASNFNTTPFAAAYPEEDITNSNEVSTRYIENGGFLRLNNATLAYTLSGQKIGLGNAVQNIRLSVTGQNLLILTDYTGFDPEVNTNSSLGGIQSFGIDRFMYPSARTVLFGLNVTF
ncbi:MAG: SusC/RagA family TonB-linked outer membrane protein [Saprospiraceae bacterium]|nr:SusC/RagA family TonB-linked outer membrane protein [Saprospiraceae bacterium]MDP4821151.1 SusC/RagA family TonB-linked outer membrane protein [Saprospiraceae bacterium]MDP4999468.1 SusC/RagA family TonB-linked outer membrane protein [Saprospiraceae bacterium]